MGKFSSRTQNISLVWWFFCLTLAIFLCRALIPAGFMPDVQALQEGRLALVLCPAQHPALLSESGREAHVQHADEGHGSAAHVDHDDARLECPFSLLAAVALVTPHPPLVLSGVIFLHALAAPIPSQLQPAAIAGPPLGARAPPVYLA